MKVYGLLSILVVLVFSTTLCNGLMRLSPQEEKLHKGQTIQFGPDNVTQHIGYIDVNGTFCTVFPFLY